jgi:hypothetical protein
MKHGAQKTASSDTEYLSQLNYPPNTENLSYIGIQCRMDMCFQCGLNMRCVWKMSDPDTNRIWGLGHLPTVFSFFSHFPVPTSASTLMKLESLILNNDS